MKRIIFMGILISFLLVSCADKKIFINYVGRSRNWEVGYEVEGNKKEHRSYYVFKYIGEETTKPLEVKYVIDGPREGENGKFILEDDDHSGEMSITGDLPRDSDKAIEVKIVWEGNNEIVELQR